MTRKPGMYETPKTAARGLAPAILAGALIWTAAIVAIVWAVVG